MYRCINCDLLQDDKRNFCSVNCVMEYLNKIPREQVEYLFDERNIRLLEDTQYELRTEKIK